MTAQEKDQHETQQDSALESILQAAKSIDRNVEEILDRLKQNGSDNAYDPWWDNHDFDESHY